MKIFAISDLHRPGNNDKPMDIFGGAWLNYWQDIVLDWKTKVSDEDVVMICGDISWAMYLRDAEKDLTEIGNLPGKKVFIRGNHDYWWSSRAQIKKILHPSMMCLQNDAIKIDNTIFCGTRGWTVPDGNIQSDNDAKLFAREEIRLKLALDSAMLIKTGQEKIIVLLHYPPFNSKLENSRYTELIANYPVTTVVYGHLHGDVSRNKLIVDKDGLKYYLTSCDQIQNKLLEIL